MHALLIALLAAGAMFISDIVATIMVQAEAGNRGWLAGGMDLFFWYVSITTTSISVVVLNGHHLLAKIYVLVFVGAANVLGTKVGQVIGKRIMATGQTETVTSLAAKIGELQAELERLASAVHQR